MTTVTLNTWIAAPVERVFEFASDMEQAPARIKGIARVEMLTPGPIGVGTRFRETRVMFGREATEVMEFVAFDPPRGYTLRSESCGTRYTSIFRVAPEGEGTRVTCEFGAEPLTLVARLMAPLSRFFIGSIEKCIGEDLADIKRAAEAQPAPV